MRRFILGIVMLMAVPGYAMGQHRDRSERTAVPREGAVGAAAAARHTDRRAEPRGETNTPAPRDVKSDDAAQSRAGHERRSTSGAVEPARGRWREDRPQAAPLNPGFRSALNPGFQSPLNPGFRPFPDRDQRRTGQRDGDYRQRYRRSPSGPSIVFVPYPSPVVVEREFVEAAGAPVVVEQPSLARLILDVHPSTAQIFADGYYIGIPEDFRFEGGGALLPAGPHRIDILERDYEPMSFDVNLTRGQSATFRHRLTPMRAPQPVPDDALKPMPAPKQPTTFYLIPGCYMGNVPPKDANLPATCDIARAVSVQY